MKKSFKSSVITGTVGVFVVGIALVGAGTAHAAGPGAINLSSAGSFVILSKTGISTTGTTAIVGDIGVSPIAATAITGFSLNLPALSTYSTSPLVNGKVYAPGYANPTPSVLTTAIGDMQAAYTDGAGRTNPTTTELGAGNIGGLTITPGLYKWGTGVIIPTNITLSGSANDVWIFQIAQTLNVSSGVQVILSGGAQAKNVFWIVGGQTTLGTTANFSGNIIDYTAIVMNTGARLTGRALAQTAVTLDSNTVTNPGNAPPVVSVPVPTPTPSSAPVVSSGTSVSSSSAVPAVSTSVRTYSGGQVMPDLSGAGVSTSVRTYQGGQVMPTIYTSGQVMPSLQTSYSGGQVMPDLSNGSYSPAQMYTPQTTSHGIRAIVSNLEQGSNNSDVTLLQGFLIEQNKGPAARALAANGTTRYFGSLTRAALAEFQANVGISPALGNFGSITRGYLSANY
jgi:hypothetical protein